MTDRIVDTGRTNQLADDNTFRSIDNEGSVFCHERKITHENLMLVDLVVLFVIESHADL